MVRLQFFERCGGNYAIYIVSGNSGLYYTFMPYRILRYYGNRNKHSARFLSMHNNLIIQLILV